MALFRPLEQQWIDELNVLNDAVMKISDVEFGPGEATTEEEASTKGKKSKCLLTGINSLYYGSLYVYYDRINLATAFANQMIKVKLYPPIDTFYGQLENFNSYFSSIFTQNDLEDFVLDAGVTEGFITITAKPTARGWYGSVQIAYEILEPEKILVPDVNLDGVMTPNDSTLLEQASLRYSAKDFIDDAATLQAFPLGPMVSADITTLKTVLAKYDNAAWVETGVAPYSLEGAEVLYSGMGDEARAGGWMINWNMVGDPALQGVVVIKLSASSTTSVGSLYLHFHKESA